MKPRDYDSIIDIYSATVQVGIYIAGKEREDFLADEMCQDAVIRQLEIIGEAVTRISAEYKATLPVIPWRKMAGLRNILIHAYDDVDLEEVWMIATQAVPQLARDLKSIPGFNLDDEIE